MVPLLSVVDACRNCWVHMSKQWCCDTKNHAQINQCTFRIVRIVNHIMAICKQAAGSHLKIQRLYVTYSILYTYNSPLTAKSCGLTAEWWVLWLGLGRQTCTWDTEYDIMCLMAAKYGRWPVMVLWYMIELRAWCKRAAKRVTLHELFNCTHHGLKVQGVIALSITSSITTVTKTPRNDFVTQERIMFSNPTTSTSAQNCPSTRLAVCFSTAEHTQLSWKKFPHANFFFFI